jgi:hypothetical protein
MNRPMPIRFLAPRATSRRSCPSSRRLWLAIAVTLATALTACQPATSSSGCSTSAWGSVPSAAGRPSGNPIVDVRAGRHPCFDRLVVALRTSEIAGLSVRYGTVYAQGTGDVVALRGGASLEVLVSAPAYDPAGRPTWQPRSKSDVVDVSGFQTFRQVGYGGSFEAMTTIGIGVRARLPFHAWSTTSDGHALLVIDVAHTWP